MISSQAISYIYATCVYPTVDFKIFPAFIIVGFTDVVSQTFFLVKNEKSKQKINYCDGQMDGKVQQTNIVNNVEESRVTADLAQW